MKPVKLFSHVDCSSPGYLGEFLEEKGVPFDTACIDGDVQATGSIDNLSGLVFLGGPGNVNSSLEWMRREEALIKAAARRGTPVMGICLGAQMISKALGGTVSNDYHLEVGWHQVMPVSGAETHAWVDYLPDRFEVFQWHAHDFTLPPGATPLLTSECTPCQAFCVDNLLAMQFHTEITAETVRRLTRQYQDDINSSSACVQKASEICNNLDERMEQLHSIAELIYTRWLDRF